MAVFSCSSLFFLHASLPSLTALVNTSLVGNYALFGGGTDNESIFTTAMVDMAVTKGSITTAEKAAIIKPVVVEPIIKEIKK